MVSKNRTKATSSSDQALVNVQIPPSLAGFSLKEPPQRKLFPFIKTPLMFKSDRKEDCREDTEERESSDTQRGTETKITRAIQDLLIELEKTSVTFTKLKENVRANSAVKASIIERPIKCSLADETNNGAIQLITPPVTRTVNYKPYDYSLPRINNAAPDINEEFKDLIVMDAENTHGQGDNGMEHWFDGLGFCFGGKIISFENMKSSQDIVNALEMKKEEILFQLRQSMDKFVSRGEDGREHWVDDFTLLCSGNNETRVKDTRSSRVSSNLQKKLEEIRFKLQQIANQIVELLGYGRNNRGDVDPAYINTENSQDVAEALQANEEELQMVTDVIHNLIGNEDTQSQGEDLPDNANGSHTFNGNDGRKNYINESGRDDVNSLQRNTAKLQLIADKIGNLVGYKQTNGGSQPETQHQGNDQRDDDGEVCTRTEAEEEPPLVDQAKLSGADTDGRNIQESLKSKEYKRINDFTFKCVSNWPFKCGDESDEGSFNDNSSESSCEVGPMPM